MQDLYVVVCRNTQQIVGIYKGLAAAKANSKKGVTSMDVYVYQPSIRVEGETTRQGAAG